MQWCFSAHEAKLGEEKGQRHLYPTYSKVHAFLMGLMRFYLSEPMLMPLWWTCFGFFFLHVQSRDLSIHVSCGDRLDFLLNHPQQ